MYTLKLYLAICILKDCIQRHVHSNTAFSDMYTLWYSETVFSDTHFYTQVVLSDMYTLWYSKTVFSHMYTPWCSKTIDMYISSVPKDYLATCTLFSTQRLFSDLYTL